MENTLGGASSSVTDKRSAQVILVALAALVMLITAATLTARLTGYTASSIPESAVVQRRDIGFKDLDAGEVVVFDWQSQDELKRLAAGEGSFLRGVVRSLVRQRRGMSGDLNVPFLLTRHSDGRLVITDSATGESIDLVAFGQTNIAVFAELLPATRSSDSADSAAPATGSIAEW